MEQNSQYVKIYEKEVHFNIIIINNCKYYECPAIGEWSKNYDTSILQSYSSDLRV